MASSLLRSLNLPSEGLTLEFLCGKIFSILLQPTITGVGLLASIYCPGAALSHLPLPLQRTATNFQITASLACLVSAGLIFRLNCWLSNRALNHFTTDSTWDWEKEIALVTGGSSGIGALVVEKLAEQNIKVISIDINPPLKPLPKSVRFYQVDITSFQNIHSISKKIKDQIGNPSILVNNAGIATASSIIQKSEHEVRRVFDVNIISHFALLKEFLPDMVKNNHGHIVTVASMASFMVHAGGVDYACSKAAALSFHEGLNQELQHMYKATRIRTT
jgi:NADP-dependent 3-hydroxy acid dehydrogenase YdfG